MGSRQLGLIAAATVAAFVLTIVVIAASIRGSDAGSETARAADRSLAPYWIVRRGQTYETIADRTGLTIDELETFNPRTDPRSLVPGQAIKLRLHPPPRRSARRPGGRIWVVRRGQSFASIAARTGLGILELQRLNPRLKPDALQPGQRMILRR